MAIQKNPRSVNLGDFEFLSNIRTFGPTGALSQSQRERIAEVIARSRREQAQKQKEREQEIIQEAKKDLASLDVNNPVKDKCGD